MKAFLFFTYFILCFETTAQVPDSTKDLLEFSTAINPPQGIPEDNFGFLSTLEFSLSISILIFGLIIVGLEIYLISSNQFEAEVLVKFIIVTLIITGTLFLITAGYNNNQIAPVVGLFGTIAGYLLGKNSSKIN